MTESPCILPAASQPPDRDLETARLLMRGDEEGLRRLLVDHGGKVIALLRKEFTKVLDLQEIDDVVSQASVRAWRSGSTFDPDRGKLGAWFYVIARNCARRAIEAKRRHAGVAYVDNLDSTAASVATAVDPVASDREAAPQDGFLQDVQACIDGLPPQQRAVLLADFAAGGTAPTDVLAEQLQTSRNSVYVSRTNGRKALRAAMQKCGHSFDADNIRAIGGWS